MSGAEILILHVLKNIDRIDSTAVLATSKEEQKGAKDIEKTKKASGIL